MPVKTAVTWPKSPAIIKRHDPAAPITKRFAVKAQDASLTENSIAVAAAGIGNIDSHEDVIFPGAFSPEVLSEFLRSGFVALAHEWDDLPIAMPTKAEERGRMLYSEGTFHGTGAAQDVRTVVKERLDAGLSVGVSVGFFCAEDGCMWFESGVKLLDFAQANGYDLSLFDASAIAAHKDWLRAIVKVSRLVEWSIVTIPANGQAEAMSAKSHGQEKALSTVRDLEKFLRDAGMASSLAKLSISNLKESLRDAGQTEDEPGQGDPATDPAAPPVPGDEVATSLVYLSLAARAQAMSAG